MNNYNEMPNGHDYSHIIDTAPEWASWIATDADGFVSYYEVKPEMSFLDWDSYDEGREEYAMDLFERLKEENKGNGSDWQNSLYEIKGR